MGLDRMIFLKNEHRKKVKWAAVLVVLVIATAIYGAFDDDETARASVEGLEALSVEKEPDVTAGKEAEVPEEPEMIFIDVCGAVNSSNVVSVPAGSRVFEAINAAGGATSEAELKYINLAAVCEDGQKLYVPTKAEIEEQNAGGSTVPGTAVVTDSTLTGLTGERSSGGTVNINSANGDELQSLTGIGPSMAGRIIEYREQNGGFRKVEDLKNVSGIGERTFEKLKDKVCV